MASELRHNSARRCAETGPLSARARRTHGPHAASSGARPARPAARPPSPRAPCGREPPRMRPAAGARDQLLGPAARRRDHGQARSQRLRGRRLRTLLPRRDYEQRRAADRVRNGRRPVRALPRRRATEPIGRPPITTTRAVGTRRRSLGSASRSSDRFFRGSFDTSDEGERGLFQPGFPFRVVERHECVDVDRDGEDLDRVLGQRWQPWRARRDSPATSRRGSSPREGRSAPSAGGSVR